MRYSHTVIRTLFIPCLVGCLLAACSSDAPPSTATEPWDSGPADSNITFGDGGVVDPADGGRTAADSAGPKDIGRSIPDAGKPDTGVDSGIKDSGPIDTGPVDAGCPDCCTLGVCCDDNTGKAKPAGTPCGQEPTKIEFKCAGNTITRREGFAGCDGVQVGLCSADPAHMTWSGWKVIETCLGGKVCIPAVGEGKPSCPEVPVECKSNGECGDNKSCTQDFCDAGKCLHLPAASGTPCGTKKMATEYKCSSTSKGGSVMVRHSVAACDGKAETCPSSGGPPAWQPWTTAEKCPYNKVCTVQAPDKPGKCIEAPKCTPGTTCCTAEGKYAEKGAKCGDKAIDEEFKCKGPAKGGELWVRQGFKGCSGSSTWCSSYSSQIHWQDWKLSSKCQPAEKCKLGYNGGSGKCDATKECSKSSTCCAEDGFYAAKGTKCGNYAYKTESKCVSEAKGGKILERKAFGGCTGTGTWCSNSSDNLVWGDWAEGKACKANEVCKPGWSKGTVQCKSAGVCSPSNSCCTEAGEYAAKGVKCSDFAYGSEKKCESADKGGKILQRKGYGGCDGKSAWCSSSKDNLVWGQWETYQTCSESQVCKSTEWSTYCGYP